MKRYIFISVGAVALTLGLITYFLMPPLTKLVKASNYKQIALTEIKNQNNPQPSSLVSSNFTSKEIPNNPSIGKITNYPVNDSMGTAVLIPQTHRYPGSTVADPINDSAELAQNQIFDIMTDLHNKNNVKLVMTEGDPYGEVSSTKISALQNKSALLDSFTNQISKLNPSSSITNLVSQGATQYITSLNREIALGGASIRLKAKDSDIILYGSENTETLNKCAEIVRNLTYLQDRLAQLSPNVVPSASKQKISSNTLNISSLNKLGSPLTSLDSIFDIAVKLAGFTGSNSGEIAKARDTYQQIKNLEQAEQKNLDSTNKAPSRSDNPYANINDPNIIQSKIDETNSEINSIVIEQRNRETADNFNSALVETNQTIGIIAFGSGHEDGLVKELNKRGLSVIVISPKEVENPTKTK